VEYACAKTEAVMTGQTRQQLRLRLADIYIWAFLVLGAAVLYGTAANWQLRDGRQFFAYLLTTVVASALKVKLMGVEGTTSVGFLFVFIGIVDLGTPNAILIAAVSVAVQCLWRPAHQVRAIKVLWSVSSVLVAISVSGVVYEWARQFVAEPLALAGLALTYFAINTSSLSGVIALTESKPFLKGFQQQFWLLAYYCCGTSIAWVIGTMPHAIQWEAPIMCLPLIYIVHRAQARNLAQIAEQKQHIEDVHALHLRAIEALAMAVDARDHGTHDHLKRVQLYALEIGRELGLEGAELHALHAAALLHDIGKLGVPEPILSKPGRLTLEEFEIIKTHPVVGAEIVDRVAFPYPVAPLVRAHHEKWNGGGYPDGLQGEQIPLGARILSAVDCLDALVSDRPYRRGMPLDEAMAKIASEAGTTFDPRVIDVLQQRYRGLEAMAATGTRIERTVPKVEPQAARNTAPAAGFARGTAGLAQLAAHVEAATSRREGWTLTDLTRQEALAIVELRCDAGIPHQAMVFFEERGDALKVEYAGGAQAARFRELVVPRGEGLAGWVAEKRSAIINGDPLVEIGYPLAAVPSLRSALAIPVSAPDGTEGVLSLYRYKPEAFDNADFTALCALCRHAGFRLGEKALQPLPGQFAGRTAAD
jgi:putative nucleotidyltransferase with HDIG domain